MKYLINYRGKQVEIERLSNGKFKKPDFVKELESGYAGWQPKPALEFILLVQKNLSEKSYVDQALSNGKGITWLDSVRIPYQDESDKSEAIPQGRITTRVGNFAGKQDLTIERNELNKEEYTLKGRFPANLLVSSYIDCDYNELLQLQEELKNED